MNDPLHPKAPAKAEKDLPPPVTGRVPINAATDVPDELGAAKPVNELTPEEQMALFEKELKEKDWGHQPC